jgi:hypothetical protein
MAYLLDENIPTVVAGALLSKEPSVIVRIFGQTGAPSFGTIDPDLLKFAEVNSLSVVTFDKTTMPDVIAAHLSAGGHTNGVFIFTDSRLRPGRIADELFLIWATSKAEEWFDQTVYLPF